MLKKILTGLALLVIVLLIVIAMQPGEFNVARTAVVDAPQSVVFDQVNDLHRWTAWSPWERIDPKMIRTYDGPTAGVGAEYAWKGNQDVGEGQMTIVESKPNDLIKLKLEFHSPMESTADAQFDFKPQDGKTEVTWTMSGQNNFLGKAMCLVMNMDKMIGGEFEKGLANLNAAVKAPPAQEPAKN